MSDIREFLTYLNKFSDLARPSKYRVFFTTPSTLQAGQFADAPRNLMLQCETAELPSRTFAMTDNRTYGPQQRTPFESTYNDMTLTFYCTGNPTNSLTSFLNSFASGAVAQGLNGIVGGAVASELGTIASTVLQGIEGSQGALGSGMWERQFFDAWMESINPSSTWDPSAYYNFKYKQDYATTIIVTHYDNHDSPTVSFKYIDAYPISVEHQALNWADDSILMVSVTFNFFRWEPTNAAGSNSALMNPISDLTNTLATQATGSSLAGQIASGFISTDPTSQVGSSVGSGLNSLLNRF